MKKTLNVVFSSAGRRVGLIECFRRGADRLGIDLRIIACDLSPDLSAACQVADAAYTVPSCESAEFAGTMLDIARRAEAHLVVPTIDPELLPLSAISARFADFGCRVHVSPPEVLDVVRDKAITMAVLDRAGVPVPRTGSFEEVRDAPDDWNWPLFLKPNAGSASRLISIVRHPRDLPREISEPMILQEFLDGPEYTVNAFIDASGDLRSAVTHRRIRVRAGEVEKGMTERHARHADIARGIARALPGARGAFCFQIIADRIGGPKVIEINARFGGGYPLIDHAGATYAQWLLEEVAGLPSSAHDDWRDGVLMLRYDAAVYSG